MSDPNRQPASEERPLDREEERLLDAALGLAPGGALESGQADEARALSALVSDSRKQLRGGAPDADRVEELRAAARAEASTRPTSAGGFWRHLRGGLQRDRLIQVAAASLLIHLAALPVLAWIHFTAPPERSLNIRFEQPTEPLTAEPEPELLAPVELEPVLEDLDEASQQPPR